ncbi:MAG: phosphatidylglycerophosphate synthase [Porticoccaceae bacterium]|jgi:phosphatidylglycerophosphate synthase|tara:strand:- start:654 stop:1247 length:594 start_codon:yes stop_codon:yes gene_type:complete
MDTMNSTTFSIANLLSFLRLFLVPALVWLALQGHAEWFLAVLVVSLVSDIFDGYLARKLNQVSDFGAKLDSWGDSLTYACMIFGLYHIWPAIFTEQKAYLLSATLSFIIPLVFALMKFGEYPSYHTLGAKVAAVLIAPAYYILILIDGDTWFRLVILFYLLVAAEEILITMILKFPANNVGSAWRLIRNGDTGAKRR